jgi:hypothetical protein
MKLQALVLAALMATVLAGCGGGSSHKPKLAAAGSTTTTTGGDAGSTTTVLGGGPGGATLPGQTTTTVKGGTATTVPGASGRTTQHTISQQPDPQVKSAVLDKKCVHKGNPTDLQGLTVQMLPKQTLGYETVYSDYSTDASNKSYTTGSGYGQSDDNGNFRATWVVPASAPTGKTTVYLLTSPNHAPIQLPFDYVALGAKCP